MATYSKGKRQAFRPNLDMYRKSRWAKFREWFGLKLSNFKRWLAKITYKINEKGSQRLTIMVVPHNEKKIMNIQISNYILFFTTIILTVTITTSIVAISNNQQASKRAEILSIKDKDNRQQISEYRRSIESVNRRFTMFKSDISSLVKSMGQEKNMYNYSEIKLQDDSDTNRRTPRDVSALERLEQELEITKANIQILGIYVAQNKRLLTEMPSLYPLAIRGTITSYYGYRIDPVYHGKTEIHPGIDLAVFPGVHVLATADGTVSVAGWNGGYGFMVEIKHKYGMSTRYAHMMGFGPGIEVGAKVKQGQTVGFVGSTGKSTGYHLHYEVRIGEMTTDPMPFLSMK